MGQYCSNIPFPCGKTMKDVGQSAGDAGQSLLEHVNEKLTDKMDEVLNERLAQKCDATFDKAVDKLVDKTFEKTFDVAFGLMDDALDDDGKRRQQQMKKEAANRAATKTLKSWGIRDNLIQAMKNEGYLDKSTWDEIRNKPEILMCLGFDDKNIALFMNGIKPKTKKEAAIEKLKSWELPQILINAMENAGWLNERNWDVLTQSQLKKMGFGDGHIVSFMKGMNKIKKKKIRATTTLKSWGIPHNLIEKMDEQGYLDRHKWNELKDDNCLKLTQMGFRYEYISLFLDGIKTREHIEPDVILKEWGISDEFILKLTAERKLAESNWNDLKMRDFKKMDLLEDGIYTQGRETFLDECKTFILKRKERTKRKNEMMKLLKKRGGNVDDADPSEILRDWGIPSDLINKLKEEGWLHPEYWDDLLDQEYELEDLGFKHGHISTFKRKFQVWKEKQDSERKERKIQLLRKLEKPQKKQSSILKRNIDVENNTRELIKVKIIGERKYDSFKSLSDSSAKQQSKQSERQNNESNASNIKSTKQNDSDSTKETNKTLDVKVGATGVIPQAPGATIGVDVGVNKSSNTKSTNKTHSASEDIQDTASQSNKKRRNAASEATEQAQSAQSKHQWDKVNVGFTDLMPGQTIGFPVQIDDPNAVVYMTIYRPLTKETVCDNVQIDANFIKIESVKVEGFGNKIKWQHAVKPPKNPKQRKLVVDAEQGTITADNLCKFMKDKGVNEWIIRAIKRKLKDSKYDVSNPKDMMALERHVHNAVAITIQLNAFDAGPKSSTYSDFKQDPALEKQKKTNKEKLEIKPKQFDIAAKGAELVFTPLDDKMKDYGCLYDTGLFIKQRSDTTKSKDINIFILHLIPIKKQKWFKIKTKNKLKVWEVEGAAKSSEFAPILSLNPYPKVDEQLFEFIQIGRPEEQEFKIKPRNSELCLGMNWHFKSVGTFDKDKACVFKIQTVKQYNKQPQKSVTFADQIPVRNSFVEYDNDNEQKQDDDDSKNEIPNIMNDNDRIKELVEIYVKSNVSSENTEKKQEYYTLSTDKLCEFIRKRRVVSEDKMDFIQDALGGVEYKKEKKERNKLIDTVVNALNVYDKLSLDDISKDDRTIICDIETVVKEYQQIVFHLVGISKDHNTYNQRYKELTRYNDYDSDDEELETVSKFFDVDGYSILKKWGLENFYERMVDEGWGNPLDWIHLDDYIMKQNLGFRPGHIQIFNRKFDLWVSKYNEIRRTIPPKRKGKDGTLIVGEGETKLLRSSYNYEFTKVIVRKKGKITTESWSPHNVRGGVLFIRSYQEIVLEDGAAISVNGKGCWGSRNYKRKGYGTGGGGSVGVPGCGAGGAGHTKKGSKGFTPQKWRDKHSKNENDDDGDDGDDELKHHKQQPSINIDEEPKDYEVNDDLYHGYGGKKYGNKTLDYLKCDYDHDFDENGNATDDAAERFKKALGSGGGCGCTMSFGKKRALRGESGGGAVKIICDTLIMYEGSMITANGYYDPNDTKGWSAGGSGGSIWVTVNKYIDTLNKGKKDIFLRFSLKALGGGMQIEHLKYRYALGGKAVGLGSYGRIRLDYHSPSDIRFDKFEPRKIFIGEGDSQNNNKNDREESPSISSQGTVDNDDNIKFKDGNNYSFKYILKTKKGYNKDCYFVPQKKENYNEIPIELQANNKLLYQLEIVDKKWWKVKMIDSNSSDSLIWGVKDGRLLLTKENVNLYVNDDEQKESIVSVAKCEFKFQPVDDGKYRIFIKGINNCCLGVDINDNTIKQMELNKNNKDNKNKLFYIGVDDSKEEEEEDDDDNDSYKL